MKLRYCSVTGADDVVAVGELNAIAEEFPFVEWAILLLPPEAGKPRYPSPDWISEFKRDYTGAHTAMHLCGEALLGFIKNDPDILELMSGFNRIQLNLKFGNVEGRYEPEALAARVRETPAHQFIIQYAPDKRSLLPLFTDIPNHAVLYDESAGEGISPARWDPPLPGHFCGYAGGLNPDNIAENLAALADVAKDHETWIDLETGARTDNRFDLAKVRAVLEAAAPYAAK